MSLHVSRVRFSTRVAAWSLATTIAGCTPATLNPESQVRSHRDPFTGRDSLSLAFEFHRSFATAGDARFEYVRGSPPVRLLLSFQGSADYADCHRVEMAIDGEPAPLGQVGYEVQTSKGTLVEELSCDVPAATLDALLRAQEVSLRVCRDTATLSWVERDGLKELARRVRAEVGSAATAAP